MLKHVCFFIHSFIIDSICANMEDDLYLTSYIEFQTKVFVSHQIKNKRHTDKWHNKPRWIKLKAEFVTHQCSEKHTGDYRVQAGNTELDVSPLVKKYPEELPPLIMKFLPDEQLCCFSHEHSWIYYDYSQTRSPHHWHVNYINKCQPTITSCIQHVILPRPTEQLQQNTHDSSTTATTISILNAHCIYFGHIVFLLYMYN